jgi:aminopeptidase N
MLDAGFAPQATRAADYQPPAFRIPTTELIFDLDPERTRITSRLVIERVSQGPLVLDGDEIELVSLSLNGKQWTDYQLNDGRLHIQTSDDRFTLEVVTQFNPSANTKLMGLYVSGGNFCTQCEAEGFRRMTYYLDRPDVLSRYHVTLRADKSQYPVLLSNGNLVSTCDLPVGRHEAVWDDPHPKPCYLFAAVAGNLKAHADRFKTQSGRDVALNIWVDAADLDRCAHAMESLKRSMAWDEHRYGREYDLDVFNIVAVSDFNFGAMENKGLNVFNSKYVLAKPQTATDFDYDAVESVIAHEYFHNWTGNRVTCRDWFQLSLKEGLTVFRDQDYSADQGSAALKRIDDVRALRASQFPEDAGPLAHPVRPESYIEISNFYTSTVYSKGAEVIRMMEVLLGRDGFRAGMDLYFERHDGQAVTCEDFIRAMEDATGKDLAQFRLWYSQAGTPRLDVQLAYDAPTKTAHLHFKQTLPDTPGQHNKNPMHIPVRVRFFDAISGKPLGPERLIELRAAEESIAFSDIGDEPIPSLLRGFSAPVLLQCPISRDHLAILSAHDDDAFSRYESLQKLAIEDMRGHIDARTPQSAISVDPRLTHAIERTLRDPDLDPALIAEAVVLPSEAYLGEQMPVVDVEAIHRVRQAFRVHLTQTLRPLWRDIYHRLSDRDYEFSPPAKARRRLKNIALQYLLADDDHEASALCFLQFADATNMTDQIAALTALMNSNAVERTEALDRFYAQWHQDPLVLDKWFTLQALSTRPDTLPRVMQLTEHPDFHAANPNRLRALVGAFSANQIRFHAADGAGYRYLADQVLRVDRINPQSAARLIAPLGRWRRFDSLRSTAMRSALERIGNTPNLSKDVFEMTSKSLV